MNENARRVLEAAGAQRDPAARGFYELSESASFEGEAFLRTVDPLRRFLGVGFALGHRRPSPEFFETLLGYGRSGATALLDAFMQEVPDPRSTAVPLWRAVSAAARVARAKGFISGWSLDDWKPLGGADGKLRLVAHVPPSIDERARALSFATRRSLSDIVSDALAEYADRFEEEHGPLPKRPEAAQAAAS